MTIAYDGSNFQGWQIQREKRTVQGEVEAALSKMHDTDIRVYCAGRTDSGVHATGQVINFFSNLANIAIKDFANAASYFFPKDISAISSEEVASDFHARHSATARRYNYYIFPSPVRMPHYRQYSLRINRMPDIVQLNRLAAVFVGKHDFSTFSQPNEQIPNRIRWVFSAGFYPHGDFIVFQITASSYLWKMVRIIVGSILEYEQKGYVEEDVRQFFLARDRNLAGMAAQAHGLFLERVDYE